MNKMKVIVILGILGGLLVTSTGCATGSRITGSSPVKLLLLPLYPYKVVLQKVGVLQTPQVDAYGAPSMISPSIPSSPVVGGVWY